MAALNAHIPLPVRRSFGVTVLLAGVLTACVAHGRELPRRGANWPLRTAAADFPAESAARVDRPAAPVASAVHIAQAGDLTRLVFDVSVPVDVRAFVLADPRRVIVDLAEINFQIDPNAGRSPAEAAAQNRRRGAKKPVAAPLAGVVSSFRFGLFAAGKSRIVVDLAEPARIVRASFEPGSEGQGARLVLDFAKTDANAFAVAAAAGKAVGAMQVAPQTAVVERGDATKPVVVIDPGHGGVDVGAHGADDTLEKVIVFDFAKALSEKLSASGRYQVVMTRTEDIFVPLAERVRIARQAGAALFLSLHADTISAAASVAGATVYTVSDRASDAEAARVAEKENMADAAAGLDGKEDASEVSDILFDLTRRETRAYSHLFARTLIGYMKENARLNKNPQRAAGFRVLKAPDVPSVLLELGYLSSDGDLARLRSPEWREKAAGSVARAIDSFFKGRVPGEAEAPGTTTSEAAAGGQSVAPAIH